MIDNMSRQERPFEEYETSPSITGDIYIRPIYAHSVDFEKWINILIEKVNSGWHLERFARSSFSTVYCVSNKFTEEWKNNPRYISASFPDYFKNDEGEEFETDLSRLNKLLKDQKCPYGCENAKD